MKINRKELMKALSTLYPVIGRGDENISSNNYTFMLDEEGRSFIGATNNSVAVIKPISFDLGQSCRVAGNTLFQLIKKIKAQEIEINISSEYMFLQTDSTESTVPLIPKQVSNLLDMIVDIPDEFLQPLPSNFNEALHECAKHTTDESKKPILQYVYADNNKMCSANNAEIVIHSLNGEVNKLFIPSRDIPCIKGFNLTHYVLKGEYLYFKTDDDAFVIIQPASRAERYPVVITPSDFCDTDLKGAYKAFTLESLFNMADMKELVFTDEEVKELIDTVSTCCLFADEEKQSVTCDFKGDCVELISIDSRGSHKQKVNLSSFVSPFIIRVKPQTFIDLLNRKDKIYVGVGRVIVCNDNVKHLIQVR